MGEVRYSGRFSKIINLAENPHCRHVGTTLLSSTTWVTAQLEYDGRASGRPQQ